MNTETDQSVKCAVRHCPGEVTLDREIPVGDGVGYTCNVCGRLHAAGGTGMVLNGRKVFFRGKKLVLRNCAWQLVNWQVLSGSGAMPTASIELKHNGMVHKEASTGEDFFKALIQVIDRITGVNCRFANLLTEPANGGKNKATIVAILDGHKFEGTVTDSDIVKGIAIAYLDCINQYIARH